MLMDAPRSALILVDHQARLMPAIHDGMAVLEAAVLLAQAARELGVPVLGTAQNAPALGPLDARLAACCAVVLDKMRFSAVPDGLLKALRAHAPDATRLILAGCETHVCLMQTALDLRAAGADVVVVADACGSRRPDDKALALRRLEQAGVVLASSEMVVYEWLRTCTHPAFRTLLARVKARV